MKEYLLKPITNQPEVFNPPRSFCFYPEYPENLRLLNLAQCKYECLFAITNASYVYCGVVIPYIE